jgi:hypothetical protein
VIDQIALGIPNSQVLLPASPSDVICNSEIDALLFGEGISGVSLQAQSVKINALIGSSVFQQHQTLTATNEVLVIHVPTPVLQQRQVLVPTVLLCGLVMGSPSLTVRLNYAFTGSPIRFVPRVFTPVLLQAHIFGATGLHVPSRTSAPILASLHVLSGVNVHEHLNTSSGSLAQKQVLSSVGASLTLSTSSPAFVQKHSLLSTPVRMGALLEGTIVLTRNSSAYTLSAGSIYIAPFVQGSCAFQQNHVLVPNSVLFSPLLSESVLTQKQVLTAQGILFGQIIPASTPLFQMHSIQGEDVVLTASVSNAAALSLMGGCPGMVYVNGEWRKVLGIYVFANKKWNDVVGIQRYVGGAWAPLS